MSLDVQDQTAVNSGFALHPVQPPIVYELGQQTLFSQAVAEPRVIPFDKFATPAQRESIRARATELPRPVPLKNERVEVKHARPQRRSASNNSQRWLEFLGEEQVLSQPGNSIKCDAPVAPVELRMRAAAIDLSIMAIGWALCYAIFRFLGCQISTDKHVLPFFVVALVTVPFLYNLLWAYAANDSLGMQKVGLTLVDFDGNPPSQRRRYQRMFGSIVSVLAAGMGLVWVFVDEDSLTWHDHMSNTFPTFVSEEESIS